jgi:anti-sigma B factor antagonist
VEIAVHDADTDPKVAVVACRGEMDIGEDGVDRLRTALDDLVDQGKRRVVLDLSEMTYIVSRGFGQMLVALARLRTRRGDLRVAGARGSVWTAATTVGLDNIMKFFPTVEDAVASFHDLDS